VFYRGLLLLSAIFMVIFAQASATEYFVSIVDFAFSPQDISIVEGDIVTWTNNGIHIHTSTSDDGGATWNSGDLSNGQSFSFTFNSAGDYSYHCSYHPLSMLGSVTVSSAATEHFVSMIDFEFVPPDINIDVGDIVTWTNDGAVLHTSTSDDGGATWDSGDLAIGEAFSFTFNTAGTYPYLCIYHPIMMVGTVTVGPTGGPCGFYVVGDFNGSGVMNVADIVAAFSYLQSGSPNPAMICECEPGNTFAVAMDVNNSCGFNVADIIVGFSRLQTGSPELVPCDACPPEPSPSPGI